MRFLGIGDDSSLGDLYRQLQAAGHDVKVCIRDASSSDVLNGLIDRVPDWQDALPWLRAAGDEGIILCETAHDGILQDRLRQDGYQVIGSSSFGDRLENDRGFGQACMCEAGLQTAEIFSFDDFDAAIGFIGQQPGRYVFKLNGAAFTSSMNYVGELEDGRDVCALLRQKKAKWTSDARPSFILMQHLTGVEIGIGAYFNGEAFLEPVCLDWEHKRFFNEDMGELTGEMGTLVTYRDSGPLFAATLARMAPRLRHEGYLGYININTIVNDAGVWPLEFTCRFGYPGYAILSPLHAEGWDQLFARMVRRDTLAFATHPGFALGIVMTVPPFPYSGSSSVSCKGLPVLFRRPLTPDEQMHLHFDEVAQVNGELVTCGTYGYVMVVTGAGDTAQAAREAAYGLAEQVVVPNLRYRTDIGQRFLRQDRQELQRLGWLPAASAVQCGLVRQQQVAGAVEAGVGEARAGQQSVGKTTIREVGTGQIGTA